VSPSAQSRCDPRRARLTRTRRAIVASLARGRPPTVARVSGALSDNQPSLPVSRPSQGAGGRAGAHLAARGAMHKGAPCRPQAGRPCSEFLGGSSTRARGLGHALSTVWTGICAELSTQDKA